MFNLDITVDRLGASLDFQRLASVSLDAIKMLTTIVLYIMGYLSRFIPNKGEAGVSVERFPVISAMKDDTEFQKLFRVL